MKKIWDHRHCISTSHYFSVPFSVWCLGKKYIDTRDMDQLIQVLHSCDTVDKIYEIQTSSAEEGQLS